MLEKHGQSWELHLFPSFTHFIYKPIYYQCEIGQMLIFVSTSYETLNKDCEIYANKIDCKLMKKTTLNKQALCCKSFSMLLAVLQNWLALY